MLISEVGGERVAVRLTEVEAYAGEGEDPGSHAFRGLTPRNATMFAEPGLAYIYFTYGMHWCTNIVTGPEGQASAVLLRAGEVVEGVEVARDRRPSARSDRDLARGPARLSVALRLTGDHDGSDLLARAIQHETYHLDGILFIDRLDAETRKAAMKAIRESEWFGVPAPEVRISPHTVSAKWL